jgi:copper chaperone CopZ
MNTIRSTAARALSLASLLLLSACAGNPGATGVASAPEEKPMNHASTPDDLAALKSTAPVPENSVVLWVNGLGCPLCASNIDRQLARVKGVDRVGVDLGQGKVTLNLKPGAEHPSPARLKDAVEDAGFTLVRIDPGAPEVQ